MSYTLAPYAVDLTSLRESIGSKDEALLSAIVDSDPDGFADEDDEDGVPLRLALRQLVMRETRDRKSAHQYGYALAQLCRHLGDPLPADLWSGIRWEVVEATGLAEVFERTGPPVPLPASDDFPRICFLTAEEVAATVEKLGEGHLTTAGSPDRPRWKPPTLSSLGQKLLLSMLRSLLPKRDKLTAEDVRQLLEEYEGWLREAALKKKSLVMFYY